MADSKSKKKTAKTRGTKNITREKAKKNKKTEDTPAQAKKRAEIKDMQEQRKRSRLIDDTIWGIVFIALGAFIFIAVKFNAAGEFGNALGDFMKGLFGLIGLILPWYLIIVGILLMMHKASHMSWKSFIGLVVMLLMFCTINSARFVEDGSLVMAIKEFFSDGVTLEGGGFFGMSIAVPLIKWIGRSGLYIFSVVLIIICILLMFNTPISQWMESFRNRREEKKLMKEEDRAAKEEQKKSKGERPALIDRILGDAVKEEEVVRPKPAPEPVPAKEPAQELKILLPDEPATGQEEITPPGKTKNKVIDQLEGIEDLDNAPGKVDLSDLDISEYEGNKASTKEIAKDAAEIAVLAQNAEKKKAARYQLPSVDLLNKPVVKDSANVSENLKEKARILEETLRNFNVDARVVQVTQGPAVTRYEIQPNVGVKVNKIVSLSDDIALNLRARSIRIEAPIPGKAAVGIEVENDNINMVTLREIVDSREFRSAKSKIEFAVGKDIAGKPIIADLKEMPHLLIAGSTGSGKSVCINSIITSILYKANPDEVKFVLIDPKVVELGNYNDIPHLLIPVVTDASKAAAALSWAVVEMNNRYKMFAENNVRDLSSYNRKMKEDGTTDLIQPQIVIVIDELADLMMAAPSQVEDSICRLAQMARAAGMHLIVATQRPSVDIITGLIKANVPSRIAFAVSSQYDSRTILDRIGAEKLVGRGDMLFNPLGMGTPLRVQGTFVSDEEVQKVIDHVRSQVEETDYAEDVIASIENGGGVSLDSSSDADELLPDAIKFVVDKGSASVSMLQRRYRIGYNRAARIVDQMEERGIVGPQDGSRARQVLISEEEFGSLAEGEDESQEITDESVF